MDPTIIRFVSLIGLGVLAVWAVTAVAGTRGLKTVLAIRNAAYFSKNGDTDWRAIIGDFSHVSVKVADGASWEGWTREHAGPLVDAIRSSGATAEAWAFVYLSPWRANGWGTVAEGKLYTGYLCKDAAGCPARWRRFRRAYATAEESARAEALAAVQAMRELGIDTLYINAEAAAFATANASKRTDGTWSVT